MHATPDFPSHDRACRMHRRTEPASQFKISEGKFCGVDTGAIRFVKGTGGFLVLQVVRMQFLARHDP